MYRQKAWVSRLVEELRNHDFNYFVTLTYAPESVPTDAAGRMCFNKQHIVKLNRDLRKRFQQGYLTNPVSSFLLGSPERLELPKGLKYKFYVTSEYGPSGTQRPHYHGVWYGLPDSLPTVEVLFRTLWPYGYVSVFPAEDGAAGYISKYLVSDGVGKQSYTDTDLESPFALMSKGLGLSYVERMGEWHRSDPRRMYTQYHGQKGTMDRYLKHKIFTEEQLEPQRQDFFEHGGDLKDKYLRFKQEHPLLYSRLLQERSKYFHDLQESTRWQIIKKHNQV